MRVLALDTTTRAGSVALVDENEIVEERPGDPSRTHGQRLPAEVLAVLEAHGVGLSAIDVFAVAAGPGSFTGLRIGLATIQGLAFVTRRPIVGISALEALAQVASREVPAGALVAAWMDAQRREVFSALYQVTSAGLFDPGRLIELESAGVGDPERTLERWRERLDPSTAVAPDPSTAPGAGPRTAPGTGQPVVFVGDGAVLYKDLVCGRGGASRLVMAPPPLAGAVGRMAAARARVGEAVDPGDVHPLYVRRPDAEIDRERRSVDPRFAKEGHDFLRDEKDSKEATAAMATWTIDPLASAADIDAILAIEEASFTNPWTRDMYVAELENHGVSYFYLAKNANGLVVGFCSFWRVLEELHINNLAVAPAERGAGAATALLTRVLADGTKLGARRATLEVRRSNTPARSLYEKFGFAIAGVRPAYYSNPIEDALVLWREHPGE